MVSQQPPSACISVHLSAQPFSPSSEQHSAGVVCMQFPCGGEAFNWTLCFLESDYVPDQNKSSSLPVLFGDGTTNYWIENVVPAGLAVNDNVWLLNLGCSWFIRKLLDLTQTGWPYNAITSIICCNAEETHQPFSFVARIHFNYSYSDVWPVVILLTLSSFVTHQTWISNISVYFCKPFPTPPPSNTHMHVHAHTLNIHTHH